MTFEGIALAVAASSVALASPVLLYLAFRRRSPIGVAAPGVILAALFAVYEATCYRRLPVAPNEPVGVADVIEALLEVILAVVFVETIGIAIAAAVTRRLSSTAALMVSLLMAALGVVLATTDLRYAF